MSNFNLNKLVCFIAFSLSITFAASSAWLTVKGAIGQVLLEKAFNRSVNTGINVKAWPWADTWPVAKLTVRSNGRSHIVLEGITGEAMAFGPGRVPSSSDTATQGTFVVGGHRDSHLSFLKNVKHNEVFEITTVDGQTQTFQVKKRFVADSKQDNLMIRRESHSLVLITCYPFNALQTGGSLRYVVVASPIGNVTGLQTS